MNTVAIVQARMGSTRLPGKVLRPVLDRPLLEILLERLGRASRIDRIVVATSTLASDDAIAEFCERTGTHVHRGSESDVLARYHGAAKAEGAETVVRVTGDCPLLDPTIIDRVIARFSGGEVDYASNTIERSYPRGLDVEVFSIAALDAAFTEATAQPEREHVTPFIWRRGDRFRLASVVHPTDLHAHRWTVDTAEDFELVRRMLEALLPMKGTAFNLEDCLALIAQHPDWTALNAHIEQREVKA